VLGAFRRDVHSLESQHVNPKVGLEIADRAFALAITVDGREWKYFAEVLPRN
jgi:hypothetical protein